MQYGGILGDLIGPMPQSVYHAGVETYKWTAPELAEMAKKYYINKGINKLKKNFKSSEDSGIIITSNSIKDIMKVTISLENGWILSKGTTRKSTSQEGGFLNFLKPLMTVALLLMKSALTPLAQSVLLLFGLITVMSATDPALQKKIYGSGATALITSNEEMEDITKIIKSFDESGLLIKGISETTKN